MNPYQCGFCDGGFMHAEKCPMLKGRCGWCAIVLTWWERLIRPFYLGYCGECRAAIGRNDPSPPTRYQSRYWVCRKYRSDHTGYCAGHHSEFYR